MWWRSAVICHHVEQERQPASVQQMQRASKWTTNWAMQSPYIPPAVLHLQQKGIANIRSDNHIWEKKNKTSMLANFINE
jgi:hypothetical protein